MKDKDLRKIVREKVSKQVKDNKLSWKEGASLFRTTYASIKFKYAQERRAKMRKSVIIDV